MEKPALEKAARPSVAGGLDDGAGLSNSDLLASWASAGAGEGRDLLGWAGLAFSLGRSSGVEIVGQVSRLEIIWTAGAGGLETSGRGARLKVSSSSSSSRSVIIPSELEGENLKSSFDLELDWVNLTQTT